MEKITSVHVIPHNIKVQGNEIAQAIRKVWELTHKIRIKYFGFGKHKSVKIETCKNKTIIFGCYFAG